VLQVQSLVAGYDGAEVLHGVDLSAAPGAVTCVMGRNGAGKSTLLKAIIGLIPADAGRIAVDGVEVQGLPAHRVPGHGIALVPQGRRLFGPMTVAENLSIGLLARGGDARVRAHVLHLFPRLAERLSQVAATLSGGEQQMLAMARALCLEPRVLLLDEPTEGLQPSMALLIREVVLRLKADGVAVVLVEQKVETVLALADRVVFLDQGRVAEVAERGALGPGAAAFARHVGV
jgi:branched-chain amino acid transport system ATP-binding protein